jgi:hypothetical protein
MKAANAQAWLKKHHQVSENAFAVTFAEVEEKRWRYNEDEKAWLQWVGTHWARNQTPELLDAVRQFMSVFVRGLRTAQALTHAESVKYQTQRTIAAIEKLCRSMPTFLTRCMTRIRSCWGRRAAPSTCAAASCGRPSRRTTSPNWRR